WAGNRRIAAPGFGADGNRGCSDAYRADDTLQGSFHSNGQAGSEQDHPRLGRSALERVKGTWSLQCYSIHIEFGAAMELGRTFPPPSRSSDTALIRTSRGAPVRARKRIAKA